MLSPIDIVGFVNVAKADASVVCAMKVIITFNVIVPTLGIFHSASIQPVTVLLSCGGF